jgi:hypothetical protein
MGAAGGNGGIVLTWSRFSPLKVKCIAVDEKGEFICVGCNSKDKAFSWHAKKSS